MHDLAIRNARIYDGDSRRGVMGDIGIVDGMVVEIEEVGSALVNLEANGHVVAPGFIDAHTHDDAEVYRRPSNSDKLRQGVTTVVTGNCGFSAFPNHPGEVSPDLLKTAGPWTTYAEYANALEAQGIGTNVASFIGHNTAQRAITGVVNRRATSRELSDIIHGVREAMGEGALGVSTGLIYEPGRYATTDDLIEIVSAVSDFGGLYASHLRDEAEGLGDAVAEAIHIARSAGTGLELSHLKVIGPDNWGSINKVLAQVDAAAADGLDIGFDLYPYTAGSGPMQTYFDPSAVDLVRASLVQIVHSADFPEYGGRRLTEIADTQARSLEEVTIELVMSPQARETICIIFEIDEDDVQTVLAHPLATIGSDGIPLDEGVPHPRLTDTFPRVLGRYGRELGLFDLSDSISKMTSRTADRFGLNHRGRLTPGSAADLVVFDAERILDRGTFQERGKPEGIEYVLVNGEIAVDPSGLSGRLGGRVLKRLDGEAPEPGHAR